MKSSSAKYSIRKHISFWSLTLNGQEACFDHEQGAYYVAYLLLNPPDEPIHGMALEMKAEAFFATTPPGACETYLTDPETGETITLGCDDEVVERHLHMDDSDGLAYIRRKTEELEAILENQKASEPVKAEVWRELEQLYAYQQKNEATIRDTAQRSVRKVRLAMRRLQHDLACATTPAGKPHVILRAFAEHLQSFLFVPSSRFCKFGHARTKANGAGCFIYEPPLGVVWG